MNTLYKKVLCSERLPDDVNYHDTDDGSCYYYKKRWYDQDGPLTFIPEWWLEEVNIPTDEEIEKRMKNIYPHWESDWEGSVRRLAFIRGFKAALELLTL